MSEFDPRAMIIRGIKDYMANDARSLQEEIGPSATYGCKRRVWHEYNKTPHTNEADVLAAFMGKWIHKGLEHVAKSQDPFDDFLTEIAMRVGDLPGHADFYSKGNAAVVDWKTSTKKNLKKDSFPSENYYYQSQIYGYQLVNDKGFDVKTVWVVGVPRDGKLSDIVQSSAPYSEAEALKGIQWIEDVKNSVEKPAPEMPRAFCEGFCPFYDPTAKVGCPSRGYR